jgi:hypothetical protein
MSLSSFKEAFKDSFEKKKKLDEIHQWFSSLSYDEKTKLYEKNCIVFEKQTIPQKGICKVCGVKVNPNFEYCKEHYPKTKIKKKDEEVIRL